MVSTSDKALAHLPNLHKATHSGERHLWLGQPLRLLAQPLPSCVVRMGQVQDPKQLQFCWPPPCEVYWHFQLWWNLHDHEAKQAPNFECIFKFEVPKESNPENLRLPFGHSLPPPRPRPMHFSLKQTTSPSPFSSPFDPMIMLMIMLPIVQPEPVFLSPQKFLSEERLHRSMVRCLVSVLSGTLQELNVFAF